MNHGLGNTARAGWVAILLAGSFFPPNEAAPMPDAAERLTGASPDDAPVDGDQALSLPSVEAFHGSAVAAHLWSMQGSQASQMNAFALMETSGPGPRRYRRPKRRKDRHRTLARWHDFLRQAQPGRLARRAALSAAAVTALAAYYLSDLMPMTVYDVVALTLMSGTLSYLAVYTLEVSSVTQLVHPIDRHLLRQDLIRRRMRWKRRHLRSRLRAFAA